MNSAQKTILLIEDDPVIRRLTKDLLGFQNYQVLEAKSSRQALDILDRQKPDLIMTDISLPDMDGISLTRKIRAREDATNIPILMLTASATYTDKKAAAEAGATGFISKPVDIQKLLTQIQELING